MRVSIINVLLLKKKTLESHTPGKYTSSQQGAFRPFAYCLVTWTCLLLGVSKDLVCGGGGDGSDGFGGKGGGAAPTQALVSALPAVSDRGRP